MPNKTTPSLKVQPKDPAFNRRTDSFPASPEPFALLRYMAPITRLATIRITPKKLMPGSFALSNPNGAIKNKNPLATMRE